jgi:hypothetical protein
LRWHKSCARIVEIASRRADVGLMPASQGVSAMMQSGELSARGRVVWLAGAVLLGLASQWCINFGPCAAPLAW